MKDIKSCTTPQKLLYRFDTGPMYPENKFWFISHITGYSVYHHIKLKGIGVKDISFRQALK